MRIIDIAVSRARTRVTTRKTTLDAFDNSAKAQLRELENPRSGTRSGLIEARMLHARGLPMRSLNIHENASAFHHAHTLFSTVCSDEWVRVHRAFVQG